MAHTFMITIRGSADSADAVSKVAADAAAALKALGATVDSAGTTTQQTIAGAAPAPNRNRKTVAVEKVAAEKAAAEKAKAAPPVAAEPPTPVVLPAVPEAKP